MNKKLMLETSGQPTQIREDRSPDQGVRIGQGREWILSVMTRANEIARVADTSGLIQGTLELMMQITLADSAFIFQLDSVTDELVITQVRGDAESQHLVGMRLNRQQGLPGISLCETRVVVVGDLPSEPDWLYVADPVSAAHKRNVINLPLSDKDLTLGVIQLFNYQQAELDLLMVLADRLAVEIHRRREIESTQKSNQRLYTLVEMLGEVAGTLDRNRLLHLVTENASRLVGAERSSIFLVDPESREMIYHTAYQSPEPGPGEDPGDKNDPQNTSSNPKRLAPFQAGEFSYFNRSAITVPIRSEPPSNLQADDHKHVLGGLVVHHNKSSDFNEEDAQLVHILAEQAGTFLQVAEMYESAGELFLGVIEALSTAIDAKDPYTRGHSKRVSNYAVLIARELGLDETAVNDLRIGSLFHDIGKIGIPDGILLKNGALDGNEMAFMKRHPRLGVNILSQVKLLEPMIPAILEHHERLDGSGYPAHLTDKQISGMGRIVAVADVFDAMTSNRPYRIAQSSQEVLAYLQGKAGKLYDVECVRALDHIITRSDMVENSRNASLDGERL